MAVIATRECLSFRSGFKTAQFLVKVKVLMKAFVVFKLCSKNLNWRGGGGGGGGRGIGGSLV